MNLLEVVTRIVSFIGALYRLIDPVKAILKDQRKLTERLAPSAAYENLLLDIALDIKDAAGSRATVEKRQRVRFLVGEAGVVRDIFWGEGSVLAHYSARGARRLMVAPEGSKRAILLGLEHAPRRGERATVMTRRLIQGGFTGASEYFEAMVERPTKRLVVRVRFPRNRPPKEALLATEPPKRSSDKLVVRYAPDGRPFLSWSKLNPDPYRLYSLRWSW